MNKPAFHNGNWGQPVTDNWTAIENLIDKNTLTAKGDQLVATGPSAPGRFGAGSDGQLLTADNSQASGVKWAGSIGLPDSTFLSDVIYNKRFFSSAGLLPGTKYYETPADQPPIVDWDNTGIASVTAGSYRRWQSVASTQVFGWDLGMERQRILFILTGFQPCGGDRLIFMSNVRTTSGDIAGNGYAGGLSGSGQYRWTNGVYGGISATNIYPVQMNIPYAVAMSFDNGNVRYFYRFGNDQWMEGTWFNDGTFTKLRHCGIRMWAGGSLCLGPVSIYYDT
jgi:hypothetical protein